MRRGLPVGLLLACASPASAVIVEFDFTGEVESVNPYFASIVALGSPLAGRLVYDTDAVDSNGDATARSTASRSGR